MGLIPAHQRWVSHKSAVQLTAVAPAAFALVLPTPSLTHSLTHSLPATNTRRSLAPLSLCVDAITHTKKSTTEQAMSEITA
jgi:hypothetical protein